MICAMLMAAAIMIFASEMPARPGFRLAWLLTSGGGYDGTPDHDFSRSDVTGSSDLLKS